MVPLAGGTGGVDGVLAKQFSYHQLDSPGRLPWLEVGNWKNLHHPGSGMNT